MVTPLWDCFLGEADATGAPSRSNLREARIGVTAGW